VSVLLVLAAAAAAAAAAVVPGSLFLLVGPHTLLSGEVGRL
jgi:hypothetical protein